MAEQVGPCPHCGKSTVGIHIAGTVYDYQCQPCVDEVDDGFERFLDRLYAEPDEPEDVVEVHASPHCACGINDAGQRFVDPICRRTSP